KPIEELKRELGLKDIIKLASNENPLGPSPKAIKALSGAVSGVNRYPDGSSFYLKGKIAKKFGLSTKNITIGNGSDELIDTIIKTFTEEHDEVLITKPAFLEYSILSKARGVKVKTVPIKNFQYDIKSILNAINSKTKVIFIGNPDNPTGAYLNKKMLGDFIKGCPNDRIVVFDEAYRELVDKKDYSNPFKYIDRKNIIILRTFSKSYGLAGLRIGYGLANKRIIAAMEKVRLPFNVNLLAQKAAEAALGDVAHIARTKKVIKTGKKFLVKSLEDLGFKIVISPTNFILVNCGKKSGNKMFKKLLKHGVIVRDMKAYDLPKFFRVNVGTMRENRRFIEALKAVYS
ncbi:MAG: histidinol-phosphate transaminase, partial [Candidatus Omnitrophota bacterium]